MHGLPHAYNIILYEGVDHLQQLYMSHARAAIHLYIILCVCTLCIRIQWNDGQQVMWLWAGDL